MKINNNTHIGYKVIHKDTIIDDSFIKFYESPYSAFGEMKNKVSDKSHRIIRVIIDNPLIVEQSVIITNNYTLDGVFKYYELLKEFIENNPDEIIDTVFFYKCKMPQRLINYFFKQKNLNLIETILLFQHNNISLNNIEYVLKHINSMDETNLDYYLTDLCLTNILRHDIVTEDIIDKYENLFFNNPQFYYGVRNVIESVKLSDNFIKKYEDKLNEYINKLIQFQQLPEWWFEKHKDILSDSNLIEFSRYQHMSYDFIKKHKDLINPYYLRYNKNTL